MKRAVCPVGQIDIFSPEEMEKLFAHQHQELPKLELPIPQRDEVDTIRVAAILHVNPVTVCRLCERGDLKSYTLGGRKTSGWRISFTGVLEFCDRLRLRAGIPPRKPAPRGFRPKDEEILPFPWGETIDLPFAMDQLNCGRAKVLQLIESGRLTAYRLIDDSTGPWRIHRRSLERYIASLHRQFTRASE